MRKVILVVVSMILLLMTVSCACSKSDPTIVDGPAYAKPMAEAMLQAITNGDYDGYVFYMSDNMMLRTTEDIFNYFRTFYGQHIGAYVSMYLTDFSVEGDKTTTIFKATYTQSDEVTVTVVFIPAGTSQVIDSLILDAPELYD